MQIRFLGAAQQVTGSMHLIETSAGNILVDCGFFQGRREESREKNRNLPREAVAADVLLLSHAHIDHSGSIPTLVKRGFAGTIHATPATRDLCAVMLRDSARIQESDAEYLNRKHADDPEWKPLEPIYTERDAVVALTRFVATPYRRRFQALPGVMVTFLDAGHILGSAQILIEVEERGKKQAVLFSGDLGRKGLPILRDPEPPPAKVDWVLLESTYGNRVHGDLKEMHDDLARVVGETAKRGGKVLIPAFAVGRTQEVVHALAHLSRAGRLPDIPVFIDSPLSVNVTEIFKLHPDCYDEETSRFLEETGDAFGFEHVRYVRSKEESMRLNGMKDPAIIIASSGMCEAGRILHHLKNNVEDERNTIMVVGYMAQHTLGRRLVERRPRVKIFGVERDLRARVEVMNAFSAHADKKDLFDFAKLCGTDTRGFFLVHGEPDQQEPLVKEMGAAGYQTRNPAAGDVVELG